jgi:transposase
VTACPEARSFEEDGVMSSSSSKRYPPELRERAVRMVAECRHEHPSEWATIESVAAKLGIGTSQTLSNWVRRAEVDAGRRAGVSSDAAAELKRLRAENRELKRANEILKSASVFFAAELDRGQK